MHRVELKIGFSFFSLYRSYNVPNAPCGVESAMFLLAIAEKTRFLMHRVELKEIRFHFLFRHRYSSS